MSLSYEKLRLKVGCRLLGFRGQTFFAYAFPYFLRALMRSVCVLAFLRRRIFEFGEHKTALFAALLLSLGLGLSLLACSVLVRDRWLSLRADGSRRDLNELVVAFSLADFGLAVKLELAVLFHSAVRFFCFAALPLALFGFSLYYLRNGASLAMLIAVLGGAGALLAVGFFFFAVSLGSVFAAAQACCFSGKDAVTEFGRICRSLDKKAFKLMGFRLTFYPWLGSKKALASCIFVKNIIKC